MSGGGKGYIAYQNAGTTCFTPVMNYFAKDIAEQVLHHPIWPYHTLF
jgi:hypothetical protein